METHTCNVNQLKVDAHLPPRKRLLAGLKRQNPDVNSPVPSTPSSAASEIDALLNNSFRSQLSNHSLPNEETVEASRIAAIKAMRVAEAARANAEEKAAKAAMAVTAAKSALYLVSIISDEGHEAANKDRFLKKNKMKKHVTVEVLYNKNKGKTKCRTDEEMARKLHQTINSSPRIMKKPLGFDMKSQKQIRLKSSGFSGRASICRGVPVGEGNRHSEALSNGNGNGVVGEVGSEGPIKKMETVMVVSNTSKLDKRDQLKLDDGEGFQPSKTKRLRLDKSDVLDSFGKKRGRFKQKKLPLSICSFRDQSSPIEELKSQGMQLLEENGARTTVENESFSMGHSGNSLIPERTSMWKCQSFKPPACIEQNKVMQSWHS